MSFIDELRKEVDELPVHLHKFKKNKNIRNQEIVRRQWEGERAIDICKEYDLTATAVTHIRRNIEKKLRKTGLSKTNYLNTRYTQ